MTEVRIEKRSLSADDLVRGVICGLRIRRKIQLSAKLSYLCPCFQALLPKINERAVEDDVRLLYAIRQKGASPSLESAILGLLGIFITVEWPYAEFMHFTIDEEGARHFLEHLPFDEAFWVGLADDFLRVYHRESTV